MAIKESSDELNPPVVTTRGFIARSPAKRSLSDYVALAIATCGVGYFPVAPGTWGSALGVGIYLLSRELTNSWFAIKEHSSWKLFPEASHLIFTSLVLVIALAISLAGVWAATRVERLDGRKDPRKVVIDEVAGQLITFLFLPFLAPWWLIAIGFFLFRVFDIWKPYPIRRLEALESGLGIMADDVLAGIYAAIVLLLLTVIMISI